MVDMTPNNTESMTIKERRRTTKARTRRSNTRARRFVTKVVDDVPIFFCYVVKYVVQFFEIGVNKIVVDGSFDFWGTF